MSGELQHWREGSLAVGRRRPTLPPARPPAPHRPVACNPPDVAAAPPNSALVAAAALGPRPAAPVPLGRAASTNKHGCLPSQRTSSRAPGEHERCAAALHLNHYSVRSREDFVRKFRRGRISSRQSDRRAGLATAAHGGALTRASPSAAAVASFLNMSSFSAPSLTPSTPLAARAAAYADAEFSLRDSNARLDESIIRFAPLLRSSLRMPAAPTSLPCGAPSQPSVAHLGGPPSLYLFVHVPKCAGTSFRLVLRGIAELAGGSRV